MIKMRSQKVGGVGGRAWMVWAGVALLSGMALGMPATLPAGHPAVGGAGGAGAGAMPGTMPPGHPPMGGGAGAGAMPRGMPAGHPPLDQMGATTAPAKGSITVHVVSGGAGGGPVASAPIVVELYHQGVVLQKWEAQLNAQGVATIPDVLVKVPCQALVTVKYKGLEQQGVGSLMMPGNPNGTVEMTVWEGTDVKPEYTVGMRHVIVRWAEQGGGILVTEMMSVVNPTERAWLGEAHEESRTSFGLPLPAGAQDVQLMGGFDEATAHIHKEGVLHGSPLFPGATRFQVGYAMLAKDGTVNLTLAAPADIGQMMVFVPAEGGTVMATGLEGGQTMSMGEEKVRAFRAAGIKKGQTVTLSIAGLTAGAGVAGSVADSGSKGLSAKNVAIGGGVLLALCGVGLLFLKKPKAAAAAEGGAKERGSAGKMKG